MVGCFDKLILFFTLISISQIAVSQEAVTLKKEVVREVGIPQGWIPRLKMSANYSINSNNKVIGQTNGDNVNLGVRVDSGINFVRDTQEWRNSLKYEGGVSRTPSINRYIKSSDNLNVDTIYLYGLEALPNVGPYASVSAVTSVFIGEDVQPTVKTYSSPTKVVTDSSFKITDGFSPLTTKESAGFFYKAIARPNTLLEFRLGVGALQVRADGQLRVKEVTNTSVTLESLENYEQVGAEYGFVFSGKWNPVSDYAITGDFLTPLGSDISNNKTCGKCSDFELTNIELKASTSTKINDWANLSYEYKAIKKPQLLNEFQIQHGFLINIAYDFFSGQK